MTVTQDRPAAKPPREEDPRHPLKRLGALLDEGSLEPISPDDDSGMLAAVGTVQGLHAVGRIFQVMTQASGRIPQVSVVLGPAAGGAAYGPALTDVVILGPEGRIFVTGPDAPRRPGQPAGRRRRGP